MLPTSKICHKSVEEILALIQRNLFAINGNFQNNTKTIRKTYSFGYDFFSLLDNDRTFVPIPDYLQELCRLSINSFSQQYDLGEVQDYSNVIISYYQSGYKLEPHVDVDFSHQFTDGKHVNFYYGENVIGVILQPDDNGRLYILKANDINTIDQGDKVLELQEEVGTTYLLTGKYRRKPYYHGVNTVNNSRITVTFRTVKFN